MIVLRTPSRAYRVLLAAVFAFASCKSGSDGTPVEPRSISVALSHSSLSLVAGATPITITATITRSGGYSSAVSLTVTGAPANVVTVSPAQLNSSTPTSNISVAPTLTATPGTYTIVVHATGDGVAEKTASFTLTITAQTIPPTPTIAIGSAPSTLTLQQGATTGNTVALTLTRGGQYTGDVALALSGAPNGVTGTFAPATLSGATLQSTLTLNVASNATLGLATLTITATGNGVTSATANVALTVTTVPIVGNYTAVLSSTASTTLKGGARNTTVTITRLNGFTGIVDLSLDTPTSPGITASYAPSTIASGSNTSAVTINTTAAATAGGYALVIRLISPGLPDVLLPYTLTVAVTPPVAATTLATGDQYACTTESIGSTICWGQNDDGDLGIGNAWPVQFNQHRTPVVVLGGQTFTQLAASVNHTCAINNSGAAYCWGFNSFGQLGDGNVIGKTVPTPVAGGLNFRRITVGTASTCGVTTTDDAYCWGVNSQGELGTGTFSNELVPTPVLGGRKYRDIDMELEATCAIDLTGDLWCWGSIGPTTTTPTLVSAGRALTKVSIGTNHTCAIDGLGAAICWGINSAGQLGNGSLTNSTTPVSVAGSHAFKDIEAGNAFTCGLESNGAAFCWGKNGQSQQGNGSILDVNVLVPGAVVGGSQFTEIDVAQIYVCGKQATGFVKCWGSNNTGQLGTGSQSSSPSPVTVAGTRKFAQVSLGMYFGCVIANDGATSCFGTNTLGQLGNNTVADAMQPVAMSGGINFTSISAAQGYACGIDLSQNAYCWGDNSYGMLGTGNIVASKVPIAVTGGLQFKQISTGRTSTTGHTCALTPAGKAYCWGYNANGQLGDGTTTQRESPTAVLSALTFTQIVTGNGISCALADDNAAYCWGFGAMGSIGDGANTQRLAPTLVSGNHNFTQITTSDRTACGIDQVGSPWCWGQNNNGQVGDGTFNQASVPVSPTGGHQFARIVAGSGEITGNARGMVCGLKADGALWCWGKNTFGELMDGAITDRNVPTAVIGGLRFNSISIGAYTVCGMGTDGEVYCWGDGSFGRFGDGSSSFNGVGLPKRIFF